MSAPGLGAPGMVERLPLDRYHSGVRFTLLVGWALTSAVLYFGGLALWALIFGESAGWLWLPWMIAVLFLSQFLGRWGERLLIERWPSGRVLELSGPRLTLHERGGPLTFDLHGKVNYWRWRFRIRGRRSTRVPDGHYCCAIQLVQSGGKPEQAGLASLYAFLPPQQAEALQARLPFHEMRRPDEKVRDKTGQRAAAPALSGRDAAFMAAERARWEQGAELDPADFEKLLRHLDAHLAGFAATTS